MRRAQRVFWGPSWHPVPWGIRSPGAGPGKDKSSCWWCFGAPTEVGRNPGGILISCQSKQKRGEVTRYLLPLRIQHLRLSPRPAPSHGVCPVLQGNARANTRQQPWQTTLAHCSSSTAGPGVGSHSQHSPGAQSWPRTLQQPLDEAFAVVGNGFSEDFVCQRRKLGWNLQEESLRGMAKSYYISFPEGASNCAGTQ